MALLESRRGLAGQYGYQNNAPILNASIAQSLLGDEFYKKIDTAENELGWGTNSKYQGAITTGAGLYGVKGSQNEIRDLLATGDRYTSKISESGVVRTTDPETGQVTFSEPVQSEDGVYYRPIGAQIFNTATGEDNNGEENFNKWKNITSRLQTAAGDLKIDYRNMTGGQLLDAINSADKRIAVTGRTQFWDPAQAGIGGQEGTQHATVVYTQQDGKLVPVAPPQTFEFQDYKTSGVFRRPFEGIIDLLENPAIRMAIGAMLFTPGGLLNAGTAAGTAAGLGAADATTAAEWFGGAGAATTPGAIFGSAVPSAAAVVPSAFQTAINTVPTTAPTISLGSTPQIGGAGPVGTAGFGTALPTAGQVASGLEAAGFAPGTAANLAGTTAAGVGATNLLGGATAAAPIAAAPGISATDAIRAANTLRQLATPAEQQRPIEQQAAQMAAGAVDYSSLLNLLASQARTSGLLGTQFQPQPINLASLLG